MGQVQLCCNRRVLQSSTSGHYEPLYTWQSSEHLLALPTWCKGATNTDVCRGILCSRFLLSMTNAFSRTFHELTSNATVFPRLPLHQPSRPPSCWHLANHAVKRLPFLNKDVFQTIWSDLCVCIGTHSRLATPTLFARGRLSMNLVHPSRAIGPSSQLIVSLFSLTPWGSSRCSASALYTPSCFSMLASPAVIVATPRRPDEGRILSGPRYEIRGRRKPGDPGQGRPPHKSLPTRLLAALGGKRHLLCLPHHSPRVGRSQSDIFPLACVKMSRGIEPPHSIPI